MLNCLFFKNDIMRQGKGKEVISMLLKADHLT